MDCLRMSIRVKDKFDFLAGPANHSFVPWYDQCALSPTLCQSRAPSKRWRLKVEVDVFARHLDEAKGDIRIQRVKSRLQSSVEFSPERLFLGSRLRLRQQYFDEDEVW